MALSEKMKLKIHYAKRLAVLPRDPFRRLTDWRRAADTRARAELEGARFELEEEASSKCVTDLESAFELDVLEEIARLDPDAAEWLSTKFQDRSDAEFMAAAKEYYEGLIREFEDAGSVPEETRQAPEKERTDDLSPELKRLAKGPGQLSTPNQSDPLEASGPRKFPIFNPGGGVSEVYGVRDGRLFALAVTVRSQGEIYVHGLAQYPWYVYLATDFNESLFERGRFRRIRASTINDVKNIFELEGLEINYSKPQNIAIPDSSILDDPGAAKAPGKAMTTAADRDPQARTERLPTSQSKWPLMNRSGVHMNEKQKTVLIVVAVTVLAMLIFPPFYAKLPGGEVFNLGYGLIVNPPPAWEGAFRDFDSLRWVHVNVGLLLTQWLGVLIAGGIAFIFFKD